MIGEEKGSVAISGRSSHKMTGLKLQKPIQPPIVNAKIIIIIIKQ